MQKRVFNAKKWREAGGDVGDNSQFWEIGTLGPLYHSKDDYNEMLADVTWPDGTTTKGHIVRMMEEVP